MCVLSGTWSTRETHQSTSSPVSLPLWLPGNFWQNIEVTSWLSWCQVLHVPPKPHSWWGIFWPDYALGQQVLLGSLMTYLYLIWWKDKQTRSSPAIEVLSHSSHTPSLLCSGYIHIIPRITHSYPGGGDGQLKQLGHSVDWWKVVLVEPGHAHRAHTGLWEW